MARPKKPPEEKLIEIPCKVSVDIAEKIGQISVTTDRYRGQIARKLLTRGLAAYLRDGLLDEPVQAQAIPAEEDIITLSDGRILRGPFTITINGKTFPMDRLSDEILHEVSKILPLKDV